MKFHPLKSAREARHWSQNKIAEEVGVSVRTVRRWEQGLVMPTPYYRRQLCVLFGKTAEELGLLSDISEGQVSSSINYPSKLDSSEEDTVEDLSVEEPEPDSSEEDTVEDLSAKESELDDSGEDTVEDLSAVEQESSSYRQDRYKTPPLIDTNPRSERQTSNERQSDEATSQEFVAQNASWYERRNIYHTLFTRTRSGKRRLLELTILLSVIVILIGIAFWPSGILSPNILKIPGVTNTSPTSPATDNGAETKVEPQVHNNCAGSGWQSHTSNTYGQYYTVQTNGSSFCYQATWNMPNNLTAAKSCDFHIISYPDSNANVRYYFFTNHRDTVYVNITQTPLDWSYFPKFLDVNFIEMEIDDSQSGTIISVGPFFIQNCHPY